MQESPFAINNVLNLIELNHLIHTGGFRHPQLRKARYRNKAISLKVSSNYPSRTNGNRVPLK